MKNFLTAIVAICLLWPATTVAQDWNQETYPDYNPNFSNPEPSLIRFGQANNRRKARALASAEGLPDHVNNATTKYFPPVFNQDGGSCGSASRICYMFTHELNSWRDIDSSTPENNYPSHFVWLLTYGNSGKDEFVMNVGVPTSATYGGRTYSRTYGNYNWDSEEFGWMQGYDKWFSGFANRMTKPTSVPYDLGTEEGRLAAKSWLYNHGGDDSFHAGGLIGLGVASGGKWEKIPKTEQNDAIGVTNKYYVKAWGTQVDHALTMVGYDDRIEFDLDGNGVYGEENKDERGAWIIVNSWGSGWCNGGFIYCPYAHGGPAFNAEGRLTGFWTGELYHTRKNYRPLRTIRLKMDYSRRSEILLQAGISGDINAEKPERTIDMDHFKYAGDGHNGDTKPAPEVPMLGKWADGKMHEEPMEFGYDLTDLTDGYDRNQPLKYFFIVNTRDWGEGLGHIHEASIMDYEFDTNGVETPFDLGSTGTVEVRSAGEKTIISVVVYGAAYNAPQNVVLTNGQLTWDEPMRSGHTVKGYAISRDHEQIAQTGADTRSFAVTESGIYGVEAIYEGNAHSTEATAQPIVEKQGENQVVNIAKGGFSIPDIFNAHYEECTIEYFIKPNSLANYNNAFGPGWGTFLCHCNSDGKLSVGWNTGGHRIDKTDRALTRNQWTHVAIVVKGNRITTYIGQSSAGSIVSNQFSGIGGFGNLVFSSSTTNNFQNDASYDEIRIWKRARTATEIKNTYSREFYGEVMPEGLLAYYKGDLIERDGQTYLRDCVGGHHALLTTPNFTQETPDPKLNLFRPKDTKNTIAIRQPETPAQAGIPVILTTERGDAIQTLAWEVPALGITDWHIVEPSVTFPEPGTYEVKVKASDYEADGPSGVARDSVVTATITVGKAPAPDASFTATATEIASGDRISFKANTGLSGYAYHWSMPGADNPEASTLATGTTYQAPGTYEVTLTVISPSGEQASQSLTITVSEVAPVADFALSADVVLRGTPVMLNSISRHHPTEFEWTIKNPVQKVTVTNTDSYQINTEEPGIYDISLKATNSKGSNTLSQQRALVVVNADSHNGLTFSQSAASVHLTKPIFEGTTTQELTIEWWMNPGKLTDYCLGIGQSQTTFMLRTDSKGCMFFHNSYNNGNRTGKSSNGYVIAGQWHHYAVVYSKGNVRFYRDGEQIGSAASSCGQTITLPETFSIGTPAAQMTGSIDEFRIWNSAITRPLMQSLINQPLDDPELYVTGEQSASKLRLYYDFNQSGGDVRDLTSNGNDGTRTDFGPDGDAWGLSRGVFCLNFGDAKPDVVIDAIPYVPSDDVATRRADNRIFDLSGRIVTLPAGSSALPKGIYIINGRKRVVR